MGSSRSAGADRIAVGRSGLILPTADRVEQQLPVICGAMHYFQLPRETWDRCLDGVAELGLTMVDTYVPWSIHERESGRFDFSGEGPVDDRYERDLGGFLDACAARDLKVLVRPGPCVNAELTGYGIPWRVLTNERCLALGARGNRVILPSPPRAFPLPSYASTEFLAEANQWLLEVAQFLAPYSWPNGPIVAAQVDNELSGFFRTAAYDIDYHPDAIALYRAYLGERYGDDLPEAYGGVAVGEVEPPRCFAAERARDLVPHIDWVAFKEWMVVEVLEGLGATMRRQGLDGVPLVHNVVYANEGEAASLAAIESRLDIAGFDLYLRRHDYGAVRGMARQLVGNSRLPLLLELGWGGMPWFFPQLMEEQVESALAALMHGVKGFNLYMTVERDRWYGAPISALGERRPDVFSTTQRLVGAVRELALPELSRSIDVAVMRVRDYRRLARCASLADPLPPLGLALLGIGTEEVGRDDRFGFEGPPALEAERYLRTAEEALDDLDLAFSIVDSELSIDALADYRLLIVPWLEFIDPALLARLHEYVEQGGTLVAGPRTPRLDLRMEELSAALPEVLVAREAGLESLLTRLADQLDLDGGASGTGEEVEVAVYRPREGSSVDAPVVFVANRGERSCTTTVSGVEIEVEGRTPWDAITGDPVNLECLNLEAHQVRMIGWSPTPEESDA